jgi:hypothetical protein
MKDKNLLRIETSHFVCRYDDLMPKCIVGGCMDAQCSVCKNSTDLY